MTFIGWKAAGTLHPMSRPISTSGLLSAIEIDVSIDFLDGMCAISSCEAGLYSREYANGTLVGAYSFSLSLEWMVQLLSWF